jgi:U3 small nucleolar RNA-associated protein 14
MRDLTLRAEQKAARANKIKSKVYRKLRRKEKAKLNQTNGMFLFSFAESQILFNLRASQMMKTRRKMKQPRKNVNLNVSALAPA